MGGERSCSLLVLKTNYVYNFNVFRERKRKPKMRKDIYIWIGQKLQPIRIKKNIKIMYIIYIIYLYIYIHKYSFLIRIGCSFCPPSLPYIYIYIFLFYFFFFYFFSTPENVFLSIRVYCGDP